MRKEVFVKDEYYHIYNRGVDKRLIFLDDRDKIRFINTLYILNNFQNIPPNFDVVEFRSEAMLTPRDPMIDFAAGCLMLNHYHFMARPLSDDSISKFLHKVGVSYTMYFNKRNERSGALFESTFKAKHIDRGEYSQYLTKYIHFNPKPLFQTKSRIELMDVLVAYPWSTFGNYVGQKNNFSRLVNLDFRDTILDMNADEYKKYCFDALEDDNFVDLV